MQPLRSNSVINLVEKKFNPIAEKKCGWMDLALTSIFFATIENTPFVVPLFTITAWCMYQICGESRRGFNLERKFYTYRKVKALISEKKNILEEKRVDLSTFNRAKVDLAREIKQIISVKNGNIEALLVSEVGGNVLKLAAQGLGNLGSWGFKKVANVFFAFGSVEAASDFKGAAKECEDLRSVGHKYPFIDRVISNVFSTSNRLSLIEVFWLDFLALSMLSFVLFSSESSITKLLSVGLFSGIVGASRKNQKLESFSKVEKAFVQYLKDERQLKLQIDVINMLNRFGWENRKTQEIAFKQFTKYEQSFNGFSKLI